LLAARKGSPRADLRSHCWLAARKSSAGLPRALLPAVLAARCWLAARLLSAARLLAAGWPRRARLLSPADLLSIFC
jgi:hypothetical protein